MELSRPNYQRFLCSVKQDLETTTDENGQKFKDGFGNEYENKFLYDDLTITGKLLYDRYRTWCESNGEQNKLTQNKFLTMIPTYIERKKTSKANVYILATINA
jgi:phage/plasmid-associated DNA primase